MYVFHKEIDLDIKSSYPHYSAIEDHIRRARLERSLAIAELIASAVDALVRGTRSLVSGFSAFARAKSDPPLALPRQSAHR
jgi:hypothetical protein